jgi:hypothetical protein
VLWAGLNRLRRSGVVVASVGAELGFPVLVSWPQWLRLSVGLLCGSVVMSGAQWHSRMTRGAVESSGQRWGSGCVFPALPCLTARGLGTGDRGSTEEREKVSSGMARSCGNGVSNSNSIFSENLLTGCSTKCPQEVKIQIF